MKRKRTHLPLPFKLVAYFVPWCMFFCCQWLMARDDKNHWAATYWRGCMSFPISVFPHCVVQFASPMQVDEECCSICRPMAWLGREKVIKVGVFFLEDMTFAFGKSRETESGNENMGHPYTFHLPPVSQSGTSRFGSVVCWTFGSEGASGNMWFYVVFSNVAWWRGRWWWWWRGWWWWWWCKTTSCMRILSYQKRMFWGMPFDACCPECKMPGHSCIDNFNTMGFSGDRGADSNTFCILMCLDMSNSKKI